MKVSGPVGGIICQYENRKITFLSDYHNSTDGVCGLDCKDIKNGRVQGQGNCYTLSYYIHQLLSFGIDLFLEAAFVVKDGLERKRNENMDNIDIILSEYHNCFLRDKKKNPYLQKSWCHYVDIRDVFDGTFSLEDSREMKGANPFSGSYIVRYLDGGGSRREAEKLISFILDNAYEYFNYFLFGKDYPLPSFSSILVDEFIVRSNRRIESYWKGKMVHKVQKQLEKLPEGKRMTIIEWARKTLEEELLISYQIFDRWKENIVDTRMYPVSCLVALSSILMDVYTASRIIYHNNNRDVVVYTGSAHTNNYSNLFTSLGGKITSRIETVNNLERCVSM